MKPKSTLRDVGAAARIYRLLLKLYPAAFRRGYETEMIQIFEDVWGCARERGAAAGWQTGLHLVWDVIRTAPKERVAAFHDRFGNQEAFPMKIHLSSRRQDLLVGSLVSTLLICATVWISNPAQLNAARLPPEPRLQLIPFPIDQDPPLPPDQPEIDPAPSKTAPNPAPPQLPDYPQAVQPNSITQPIEPPAPQVDLGSTIVIPERRGSVGSGTEVFDPSALDQRPIVRFQARPQYPFEMKRDGLTGSVLVDFVVDSKGEVRNVAAVRSSNREFEGAALAAVGKWKFKPGRRNGRAVSTHMQVPINFALDR